MCLSSPVPEPTQAELAWGTWHPHCLGHPAPSFVLDANLATQLERFVPVISAIDVR